MKAKLTRKMDVGKEWAPAGTIIDHPDAFRLVEHGVAEPADEECRLRVTRSSAQLVAAKAAYPAIEAGIAAEDMPAYRDGKMVGYNPDGTWIPGPNYQEEDEDAGEWDGAEGNVESLGTEPEAVEEADKPEEEITKSDTEPEAVKTADEPASE